jgi:hypothetical protein
MIIFPGGRIITTTSNPNYERRFVPLNPQPHVVIPVPAYGPFQAPFHSLAHCAVVYDPINSHAYGQVNTHVPAHVWTPFNAPRHPTVGAPISSTVHAPIHAQVHIPVGPRPMTAVPSPVNAPINAPVHPLSGDRVHSVARPRKMAPDQTPAHARIHTAVSVPIYGTVDSPPSRVPLMIPAKSRPTSGQRNDNPLRPNKLANSDVKKRSIGWSMQLEIGKTATTNRLYAASPRGILQNRARNLTGETPAFRLELTFQGQQYLIQFMSRRFEDNLLQLFEEKIFSAVESEDRDRVRQALNNGYALEYGYWGKTLNRPIRGSTVLYPAASFHAFLNGVRPDALVKLA